MPSDSVLTSLAPPGLGEVVILKAGAREPRARKSLVILPGKAYPRGLVARVAGASRNSDGTTTVTLSSKRESLSGAYSAFSVAVSRDLSGVDASLVPADATSATRATTKSHVRIAPTMPRACATFQDAAPFCVDLAEELSPRRSSTRGSRRLRRCGHCLRPAP